MFSHYWQPHVHYSLQIFDKINNWAWQHHFGTILHCWPAKHRKVQWRATKILASLHDNLYSECLHILGLPTLKYCRLIGDMILLYPYSGVTRQQICKLWQYGYYRLPLRHDFARDEVIPDQTPVLVRWLYSREKRAEKYLLELAIDSIWVTVEADEATTPLYK